ncbi:MAG TPA: LysM peptidoglycan-binding domain-containing protein, partial [Cellvibrionaceae bacterium]|nr:LysM peptidoglycan-binding domain-containing protein [Cellvibrionaceae bacterium]
KLAQAIYRGVNSYFATQGPALAQPASTEPSAPQPSPIPAASVRPDTPKIDPRADSRAQRLSPVQPKNSVQPNRAPADNRAGSPAPAKPTAQNHRVEKGDTLEKIARRYGVSQKAIMQANGMPNGTVKLGQTLLIPVP